MIIAICVIIYKRILFDRVIRVLCDVNEGVSLKSVSDKFVSLKDFIV